ncbi:MAG TPA: NUDIX hydrolase [Mycobacteriales bacterium]|nr:NUDIX hydrolase [Mycobacteriales bacterium]HWA67565.1 NUDIX hydrolase [Mycobacteriales bacterium]
MTNPNDLFAGLVDRLRQLDAGEIEPVEPRHAATVVMVRDGNGGPEVYLLRRSASMAFAAGAFVFPGGSMDPRDIDFGDDAWVGRSPAEWASDLSSDEQTARALVCAAVRETFEESGVLLAGPDSDTVVADTSGDEWESDRLALIDRSLSFAEMMQRRGLVLRADLLRPWAHWLTPEIETRRFDTRFFVAALPEGQRTRDVGGEADRVAWMRPADAVAASEAGEMMLMPPTISALRDLATLGSVEQILDTAAARTVSRILPKLVFGENDQLRFLLPHEPDYPKA